MPATIAMNAGDLAYAEEMLRDIKNGARDAIRSAINDTLQRTKGPIAGELAQEINLGKQRIGKQIAITGRPTAYALSGELTISHEPIRLEDYKPRWSRAGGVMVTTIKSEGPHTFRHGFRARMKSGHVGFYLRQKLNVFTAQTTAQDLVKLGFADWEAKQIFSYGTDKAFRGKGIRHQSRIAFGGNFPSVNASGIAGRLPMADIMGPSPVAVIEHKPDILNVPVENMAERFHERLLSKIDWKLAGKK